MYGIEVKNMTALFSKEMLIYSIFDIQLTKPARVVTIGYFFLVAALMSPILFIFGPSPVTICIVVGIPLVAATFMARPIWGGKGFFDFMKTQMEFLFAPKHYYDLHAGQKPEASYYIDSSILVNRRRDYQKLFLITKEEEERLLNEARR